MESDLFPGFADGGVENAFAGVDLAVGEAQEAVVVAGAGAFYSVRGGYPVSG